MKQHIFLLQLLLVTSIITFSSCNSNNKNNGCLNGVFSVSEWNKVHFSQGNLQYQASTNTWRFAENQWDIIGDGNAYISSTNTGWIDLFGWGTGNNPTMCSMDYNDYITFTDWGVNFISNGGRQEIQWRTLTQAEWEYLFCRRNNATNLFGFGRVNGICGLIVLPDNWEGSKGLTFYPSILKGLSWDWYYASYDNPSSDNYSHNTYSAEEWQKMESAGAVFLPASGVRFNTNVQMCDKGLPIGAYWSSSDYYQLWGQAHSVNFYSGSMYPTTHDRCFDGQSVRLVCTIEQ